MFRCTWFYTRLDVYISLLWQLVTLMFRKGQTASIFRVLFVDKSTVVNKNNEPYLQVLVECEGDSIDLSGDMGAVGRVVVSDTTGDMYLDLKGMFPQIYISLASLFILLIFDFSH